MEKREKDEGNEDVHREKRQSIRVVPEEGFPIFSDVQIVSIDKESPIYSEIEDSDLVNYIQIHNISTGGLGLNLPLSFEGYQINDEINLIITLPKPVCEIVKVKVEFKHISENDYGVVFVDLNKKNLELISKYVNYRLGQGE